ncbi:MAG: hypothetical protein H0T79_22070 [Deltaproteobacteria bacterium]|nr:hypothetical protein [Deltaproteobacteria bacterium]
MRLALAFAVATTACGAEELVLRPVLDHPTDSDSSVLPELDTLPLTIAHAGAADDLVSQTFVRGEAIELAGTTFASDLVIHLSGRVGGSEVAYGRTCVFAVTPDRPLPTPHLFFSRSVKFAALALTARTRTGGRALTDHDGRAIIVGGDADATQPQLDVERFDPRTGVWAVLGRLAARRAVSSAALGVSTSRIAVLGGSPDGITGAAFVELLELDNPTERRIERLSDSHLGRTELTTTELTDGRIVAIGGRRPEDAAVSGAITTVEEIPGTVEIRELRARLAHPRVHHTATRLGDDVGAPVLIVGGLDAAGQPVAIAELFKPLSEDLASPTTFAWPMVVPRSRHHATIMPDGSVLIVGGIDAAGQPVRLLERFSIDAGFTAAGELPPGAGIVDVTATTLPDGRILLTGGRLALDGAPIDDAFIARLDPLDGAVDVVQTDKLAIPRAGHAATLVCDGTIIIAGGGSADLVERYNPPQLGRR